MKKTTLMKRERLIITGIEHVSAVGTPPGPPLFIFLMHPGDSHTRYLHGNLMFISKRRS